MEAKLKTFLTLCQTMNYRAAAERLHLTQPAVTRQIQALEAEYDCKLFLYNGHTLSKTNQAHLLEEYAQAMQVNDRELRRRLQKAKKRQLRIGATRTIGDYVIAPYAIQHLKQTDQELEIVIDNTESLLHLLEQNRLDYILVEGVFDKSKYEYRLFRKEPFCGICSVAHPFAGRTISVEELAEQTILLREQGSGTRDFLEKDLMKNGHDLSLFDRTVCVNSFSLLRQLLSANVGISFCYQAVIDKDPSIATFFTEGFLKEHEFNIVYLKHTQLSEEALQLLQCLED